MHSEGKWLEAGVSSLRNLRFVRGWRLFSCVLLAVSSLPIHLLYNSAVFQSLASNSYTIVVVKDSFLSGSPWDLATAERNRDGDRVWQEEEGLDRVNPPQDYYMIIFDIQNSAREGRYEEKNISDCFEMYNDNWAPQANGVILVKNESLQNDDASLLYYTSVIPRWDNWPKNLWAVTNGSTRFNAVSPNPPVEQWYLGQLHYEASSCLLQPVTKNQDRCHFQYSTYILYTVTVFNSIQVVIILGIWLKIRKENPRAESVDQEGTHSRSLPRKPLTTLGDFIASFTQLPDDTTRNMCLATKHDFGAQGPCCTRRKRAQHHEHPRKWKRTPRRWFSAVGWKQWALLLISYSLLLITVIVLLQRFLVSLRHRRVSTSIPGLWGLGFGALTPLTYLVIGLPLRGNEGLVSNVLLINLPQILLSLIYLLYNAMLSTFLVQREFSLMHTQEKRKLLRVSEPVGIQRSSYFISLPLRYGIPFYISSGAMHWLFSQSFFLARVSALTPTGARHDEWSFSTFAFSPIAMIVTTWVGFINIVAIVLLGCRKYDGAMSMVSTNSMAISAACHCLSEDGQDGSQLPIQWGVVEINADGVGHCAFTTAPTHLIRQPEEGRLYQ